MSRSLLLWAALLAVVLMVLQTLPESWQQMLAYDRAAVDRGQWWRLLTGNLVHLGWAHLAVNAGVLLIAAWLFDGPRTPWAWAPALFVCALTVTLGLHVLSPETQWSVGLSGALHGMLVLGAFDLWRRRESLGLALLAICIAKITWEQLIGGESPTEQLIGAPVIVDAHLWGALGGAGIVVTETAWRRRRKDPTAPQRIG